MVTHPPERTRVRTKNAVLKLVACHAYFHHSSRDPNLRYRRKKATGQEQKNLVKNTRKRLI
ncbi:hypothetical protein E2320_000465 [Naja naja]|nr:hypothetical protein E2320_000465 [Naja naja]